MYLTVIEADIEEDAFANVKIYFDGDNVHYSLEPFNTLC